jgi:hypothetical protein
MTLGTGGIWPFADGVNYTCIVFMAKPAPKSQSALDTLIESVTRIRAEAKERMSEEEFRQTDEKVHQLANKVRASRGRKRETA